MTPTALFDGRFGPQVEHPDSFYPVYRDMIDGARAVPAVIEMEFDTSLTRVDSGEVTVRLSVAPTDSSVDTMTGLRLVVVVHEDSVPYEMLGDTFFARMIARRVLTDTFGIPLALGFGQDFETTLVVPVPVSGERWSLSRLGVTAFVQDYRTKTVLQSVTRHRLRPAGGSNLIRRNGGEPCN